MADFRQIHTQIWKDTWFIDLVPDEKLLFIYLFSNERACLAGLYDLSEKVIAFETDISRPRVGEILDKLENDGKIRREGSLIWVPNLMRYNANNVTSPKIQAHLRTTLRGVPDCDLKLEWIRHYNSLVAEKYRMDTLSIPMLESESEQEQEHEKEQEREQDAPPAPPKALPPAPNTRDDFDDMNPALRIYEERANGLITNAVTAEIIIDAVESDEKHLAFWGKVVTAWVMCGYKSSNIGGMLDCYREGRIPSTKNGHSRAPPQKQPQPATVVEPTGAPKWMKT